MNKILRKIGKKLDRKIQNSDSLVCHESARLEKHTQPLNTYTKLA